MRITVFWIISCIYLSPCFGFEQHFSSDVLRVDYFRTGNADQAGISLHQLYRETPWAGSRTHLIDSLYYGDYRFEVREVNSGQIIFSHGYSTLFREWQTTDEAKTVIRTYPESIRMPFPLQEVSVHWMVRHAGSQWREEFRLRVDPQDPFIADGRAGGIGYQDIHVKGDPAHCLDLVILAEGYSAKQADLFLAEANRFAGYLLNARPFDAYKDRLNIRAVFMPSPDEGTDIPGEGVWKRTALNSRFYTFGSERYLTTSDYHLVMDMASGTPWDQVLILVNTERYGGGGIYNFYAITSSRHALSDFVFIHEFGHSLAGLGDEYYTSDVAYQGFYQLEHEPWEPNLTTLVDFDQKWKNMLDDTTPIPTPSKSTYSHVIGVFEGGGYMAKGMYRPAYDCTMKSARYDNFCLVCQGAIRRKLELYLR